MRSTIARLSVGLAAVLLVSACSGSSPDTSAAKTGAEPDPITVTVGDSRDPTAPSHAALEVFAATAKSMSQGAITVEIIAEATAAAPIPGSQEAIVPDLIEGTFDMAVVPTRAWSGVGVTSMRPLQAPFIIESDAQVAAITRDADLVDRLFAGLDSAGLHGLVLWPEELRHFFSFTDPILTAADVTGRTISVGAQQTEELMTALGAATPVISSSSDFVRGVADGSVTAADFGFNNVAGLPAPAVATFNLILYPKVNSLAANGDFWNGLDDTQRSILTSAAETTREKVIADQRSDAEGARQYCSDGGAVVLADAESIEGFRAAVAPLYEAMEQESGTAEVLAGINALATGSEASVEPCDGRPRGADPSDPASIEPSAGALPNGVYRYEVTPEALAAAGVSPADYGGNQGVYTWTLKDGHWSVDYPYEIPIEPGGFFVADEGVYEVDGDVLRMAITFFEDHYRPPYVLTLSWTLGDDGSLTMEYVDGVEFMRPFDVGDYTAEPWVRIGDA